MANLKLDFLYWLFSPALFAELLQLFFYYHFSSCCLRGLCFILHMLLAHVGWVAQLVGSLGSPAKAVFPDGCWAYPVLFVSYCNFKC